MTLTARDKVLVLLLPACVLFGIMAYMCTSKIAALNRSESALEKTQADLAKVVGPTGQQAEDSRKLADLNAKMKAAEEELKQLQTRIAEMQTRTLAHESRILELTADWQQSTAFTRATHSRNERIKRLNKILMRHGLAFIEDHDTKGAKVSSALDTLAQRIAHGTNAELPRLRTVRCLGGFLAMHKAIQEIGRGEALGLTVGLSMKTTEDPSRHEWTLLLWI